MKGKVLFLIFSFLLLVACGSQYESVIKDTVSYVENEALTGSNKGIDVRENSSIYVWDDGRYIGITLHDKDMSDPNFFFERVDDGYEEVYDFEELMELEPDYHEQFGEEI